MDRSDVITLISNTFTVDDYGVHKPVSTERDVFCNVQSVSGSEYFQGAANGMKPEYRFTMFKHDYQGEETVRYHSKLYTIYRTFEGRNDTLELYAEARRGALYGTVSSNSGSSE